MTTSSCEMAEASISVVQDQFICPICLDLLKDPVTTACGHSYCMVCINDFWDQEDQKGSTSCPQCRLTFPHRPDLKKNIMIADMMEKLMSSLTESVECDFCTRNKHKAVRSCLVCMASYCETHLQPHYQSAAFNKHVLVKASTRLQDFICSQHEKPLEFYCHTDQQCICKLCTIDQHREHHTTLAAEEQVKKWDYLVESQKKLKQRIQESKKTFQELKKAVESHQLSAQAVVEDSERTFKELIRSVERKHFEGTQKIRAQQKDAVDEAEGVLKRLEKEITELRRRDSELEQLSHTEDHIHFLQSFQSLSAIAASADIPATHVHPLLLAEDVTKSVSQLRDKVEEFCNQQFRKTSKRVKEPDTRGEFLKYSCLLTLDPNTVHNHLYLSEENRVVTCCNTSHWYPDHAERFDYWYQVLGAGQVCGQCYWEVEWSEGVSIAVTYKSVCRKGGGDECMFGGSDHSWKLYCSPSKCYFWHKNQKTTIPVVPSSRIGVYVDQRAGILAFYSISDTMRLLHRVQTTFTQPLYPGFGVTSGSKVKLSTSNT
ncbi:tripartite motif-containing protein 16-like isoform X3 [Brachyhypopomus gauderio]|uniref:tripartite motif-containing protein 16-like isoform X3 n=1 Tax=Brachyhypopomus gauderio TaxID=698409 RepID=UPI004042903C